MTNTRSRTKRIIGLAALTILAAVCVCALLFFVHKDTGDDVTYRTVSPQTVTMKQTITAAGQVTAGQNEKIPFVKGRKFRACTVSEKERVRAGQPLVYYMDGSHTDAPSNGIVMSIHKPERGETVATGDYISFRNTDDLYLSIHIPEYRINDMEKNDHAVILINAQPGKEFRGKIVRINGISNSLISSQSTESESSVSDDEEEEDTDENSEDEDSTYDDGEDMESYEDESEGDEEGGGMAYYTVLLSFPNDGTVRPGMSANSVVTVSNREDVLAVPVEAVQFDEEDNPFVNLVDGNQTKKQQIKIGESDAMNVEVTDGLRTDDRIRIIYEGQEEN